MGAKKDEKNYSSNEHALVYFLFFYHFVDGWKF